MSEKRICWLGPPKKETYDHEEQTRFDTFVSHGTESNLTRQVLRKKSIEIDRNMSSKMFIMGTQKVSPHVVFTKLTTH